MHGSSARMVKEVLVAYSQKRATTEAVMRSLIGFRGWLAPVLYVAGWRSGVGTMISYGDQTRLPLGELWIFTDPVAASLAAEAGALLGAYAADIPGDEIFRKLDGKWDVRVNPGSPAAETWFVGRCAPALMSMWCDAVELEEALAQVPHPDPEALQRQVFAYKWFLVPQRKSDNGLLRFTDEFPGEVAPIFTTPDNLDNYLAKLSPADREQVRSATVEGAQFFDFVRGHAPIGRVVINAFGPAASRVFYLR